MPQLRFLLPICLLAATLCVPLSAAESNEDFFEAKVRPLLAKHCHSCHGPEKQESDLRLDRRALVLQGGSSEGPAAVPGDIDASVMLQYVRHEVEGMEMPPDQDRLSDSEVATLEQWVASGLSWPRDDAATVLTMEERLGQHRESHWAFQPPTIRDVNESWPSEWQHWAKTALDRFVLRRLLDHGLRPSRQASRRTLLRRINFGLLGLPPTAEEILDFEQDTSPDAYAQLVDRLLSSPHYGEHWGRHWLDVARYADTRGYAFQRDRNYPWAYTYRDYVIRAFNEGLPYDRFVVEQLAADLLPENKTDNRSLAALGLLTVGRRFNNAHDDIDDKIDAVTRGFLGLTVACARCHDHKYDAIPTEDYYSLYGVFASSTEPGKLPLIGDQETLGPALAFDQRHSELANELAAFDKKQLDKATKDAHTRIVEYLVAAAGEGKQERTDASKADLKPALVKAWRKFLARKAEANEPTLMPWFRLQNVKAGEFEGVAKQLAEEIRKDQPRFLNQYVRDAFLSQPPKSKRELAELLGSVLLNAYEVWQKEGGSSGARAKQPAEIRQLLWYFSDPNSPATINAKRTREYAAPEAKAQRTTLQSALTSFEKQRPAVYHRAMVLNDKAKPVTAHVFVRGQAGRKGSEVQRQAPEVLTGRERQAFQQGSGRLELAHTIANDRNPLTARVFVNRVWQHHFGRPLVETPSDFGVRCEPPLQQDLLDYLARRFMDNGWSIKWLHREILCSATYQQASDDRPDQYAQDPGNEFLWRANRKRLEFESLRDALLGVSGELDLEMEGPAAKLFEKPERGRRRSVYGYLDRQDLPNLLRVFDFASPDQSAAMRATTTVPQQALFLMNSPFVLELAQRVAEKIDDEGLSRNELIAQVYRLVLTRPPSQAERDVSVSLLSDADATKLVHVLMLTNEFTYVD